MESLENTCKESRKNLFKEAIIVGGSILSGAVLLGIGAHYLAKQCGVNDELAILSGAFGAVAGMYGGAMSGQETYRDFEN